MAEKINWNFVAQVIKGPSISGVGGLDAEAYEKIGFKIPIAGTHDVTLSNTSKISLLVISTATPDSLIVYAGTPALPGGNCKLDAPHIFIGEIAKNFIGTATSLKFTNGTTADVEIQMLIGHETA